MVAYSWKSVKKCKINVIRRFRRKRLLFFCVPLNCQLNKHFRGTAKPFFNCACLHLRSALEGLSVFNKRCHHFKVVVWELSASNLNKIFMHHHFYLLMLSALFKATRKEYELFFLHFVPFVCLRQAFSNLSINHKKPMFCVWNDCVSFYMWQYMQLGSKINGTKSWKIGFYYAGTSFYKTLDFLGLLDVFLMRKQKKKII